MPCGGWLQRPEACPVLDAGMSTAAVSTAVLSSKRRRTGWKNAIEVLGAIVSR